MARWLLENGIENFSFECLDINPQVLERAQRGANENGVQTKFTFAAFDINSWRPRNEYMAVLAFQSLHHFLELEVLFEKVYAALHPDGFFMADDMIGRNGHQRWPEALVIVNEFWKELPVKYKYNHSLRRVEVEYDNWDCSKVGFEGIRAQDILPLLIRRFDFELFVGFGNVIDIFIDRGFGPNFDPANEWDCGFIDRVHAVDRMELESGRIKPTHMYAVMTKRPVSKTRCHQHMTPDFCVRR
jgi:SAM-dependent methyltransferase